jgi:branched-chain amino acid transport system permease protein
MDDETRDSDYELAVPAARTTAGPAIGKDEWVARSGERRTRRGGRLGVLEERLANVPWWTWLALFVALVALLPVGFESGYVRRIAFDTVIYILLALGLNVVVGWGGLLDLGYVAFFGVGAYTYAFVSSDKFDIHLSALLSIPLAAIVGGVVGLLVGLPSRRLVGDYLAIVTLFFFQIFLTVTNNSESIGGRDIAGGPNGIINIDPLTVFGHELRTSTSNGIFNPAYLYVALGMFVLVYVALRFVNDSRTGRAWRSLREDPLAAELMGMPVNWLKLLAFSFGAAVAALTGTLVTALNQSVFPQTFEFPLMITLYTMVILGGAGSQAGVVIGAVSISVLLEVLREPGDARYLFYVLGILVLVAALKLSVRLAAVLGGTIVLGVLAHVLAGSLHDAWTAGAPNGGGRLAGWVSHWVIVPTDLAGWVGPTAYVALVAAILLLTILRGWVRLAALVPTLYLGAFVWENVMLEKPEPTRFVILGALLVAVMVARPEGLLGEKRVEIV